MEKYFHQCIVGYKVVVIFSFFLTNGGEGFLRNPSQFPPITPYPPFAALTKLPTATAGDLDILYCIRRGPGVTAEITCRYRRLAIPSDSWVYTWK